MRQLVFGCMLIPTLALVATGCGAGKDQERREPSEPAYIAWPEANVRQSLIAKARVDVVNVCFRGTVSNADLERSKTWARRAILTWFRALKVTDENITSKVAFTCTNRHLTINLRNGNGTSFASPSVATIYTNRPYGTWTHELGHALAGLSDTYAGGAGSCRSGQPQSLMCWGAYGPRANPEEWSTLWPDDIQGIQANYRKIVRNATTAPAWADQINLEAPLDLNEPWPGAETEIYGADDQLEVKTFIGPETEIVEEEMYSDGIDL